MPQWEYKIVLRARQLGRSAVAREMSTAIVDDFKPSSNDMLSQLDALGRDGWELVGLSTRASQLNSPMTTEEVWVFKRPRL